MKQVRFFALLLLATVVMFGCSKYDDTELRSDVNDLKSRVEKLEKWCDATNGQITALQGLVNALEAKDFVTGISSITQDGKTGYTITFSKSGAITIFNGTNGTNGNDGTNGKDGKDGVTPVIGIDKDTDGVYYWTVKTGDAPATWILDAAGKKVSAAGVSPVVSVAADTDGKLYWQVDGKWLMNGTDKVAATGEQGDAIFTKDGIDLTDPDNVTITLAGEDGTKITLPRTSTVKIFDSFDNFKITVQDVATDLTLALNIKDADYKAIKAELTSSAGLTTAIKTRAAAAPWEVAITAPTFKADGSVDAQPVVSITVKDAAEGDIALLKVTIIDSKGAEHAATRVLYFDIPVINVTGVTLDNPTLTLEAGKTATLTATIAPADANNKQVTWSSDKTDIATVDANGLVTALKAGTAAITVTTADGNKTAVCNVSVLTPIVATASSSASVEGNKGGAAFLLDDNMDTYWSSKAGESTPHWAQVDLGEVCDVKKVEMWRPNGDNNDIKTCVLQLSTDGISWDDIETYDFSEATDKYRKAENMFISRARYIRYFITESNNNGIASIAEIKINGTGQSDYSSNVSLPTIDNSDASHYAIGIKVGNDEYAGMKLGTGSKVGAYTTTALSATGDLKLSFYGVAWRGKKGSVKITVNSGGTIDGGGSKTFELQGNDGATGSSPYTLTLGTTDRYTAQLQGVTAATTLTIETISGTGVDPRAVLLGVNVKQ